MAKEKGPARAAPGAATRVQAPVSFKVLVMSAGKRDTGLLTAPTGVKGVAVLKGVLGGLTPTRDNFRPYTSPLESSQSYADLV